jgi:hypothetical protein
MITQRFGWQTRQRIEEMTQHRLRRRIVEEMGQDEEQSQTRISS